MNQCIFGVLRRLDQYQSEIIRPKRHALIFDRNNARSTGSHHSHADTFAEPHFRQSVDELLVAIDLSNPPTFAGA